MRKISVCFCWVIGLFCFILPVQSDAKMMAPRPMFEVSSVEAKKHFQSIDKPNENEKHIQDLLIVASELKVEKYYSYTKEPGSLALQNISIALTKKIQEHPTWDLALSPQSLKVINPYLVLLKNTLGAQSYSWAWFEKQNGSVTEARLILSNLYEDGYKHLIHMRELHFGGSSPLGEMQFVQMALGPMSTPAEKELQNTKMQKMKNHFSNLPPSNIKT